MSNVVAPAGAAVPAMERVSRRHDVDDQLLYFTGPSLTKDDRWLFFVRFAGKLPNLWALNIESGEERQLSHNHEGHLKTYVGFDGAWRRGLGVFSPSLHAGSGTIYYIQGLEIRRADLEGNDEAIAEYPPDQVTAFTHVSLDGTRLCVPTTDAEAFVRAEGDFRRTDAYVQEGNFNSYLRVYDTRTGSQILCERVPKCWITHVQFCPVNHDWIVYNHEWASFDGGIRRMWMWDGKQHIRLRTEAGGRSREDSAVHEVWTPDGSRIIYHGHLKPKAPGAPGAYYLGRVNPDGTGAIEIEFPPEFKRYGHFYKGRSGLIVSDGYYEAPGDAEERHGQWISLQRVDWEARKVEWIPLLRHGSTWDRQHSHPHPIFNHRADAVYFTSNRDGRRAVYRVEAPGELLAG